MFFLNPHIALFANEGLVAIGVAIIGPGVTLLIARWTAKRQSKQADDDSGFRFRGELSTDNQALRAELKDLKAELKGKNEYILRLEGELRMLPEDRK